MAGNSLRSLRKSSDARLLATLEAVKLNIQSNKAGNVDGSLLSDLVSQLESDDHSIYSRLDSKVYCALVTTLLQLNASHKSERVLYLMGAALYYDTLSPIKERSIKKKKDAIGKGCLGLLLDFFMDGSKSSGMRQWVGVLALQLFQNCDSNVQMFELGPEQQRRELGNFVLKEPNEILRIICGQIITALLTAGVLPEHLWPVDSDKRLYTTFPTVTLGSRGWNQQFQNYMDNIYDIAEQPDSLGQLYFTQNVSLTPQHNFGPEDHNVMIVIDGERMIIWTGVVADTQNFNHCLEVPLGMINRMLIKTRSDSQLTGVLNVYLSLKKIDEDCYLNCTCTSINQICMVLQQSVAEAMRDDLQQIHPHLEIIDDEEAAGNQDDSRNTQHTSQTSEALQFHGNGISVVRNPLDFSTNNLPPEVKSGGTNELRQRDASKSTAVLEIGSLPAPTGGHTEINGGPIDDIALSSPVLTKGHKSMQPNGPKKQNKTTTERKRVLPLKPKAKAPLWQAQKSTADGQQGEVLSGVPPISHTGAPKGLSYEEIEKDAVKLGLQFPSTDVSTRRGMVLASNGNFENAVKLLAKKLTNEGSNKETPDQRPRTDGEIKKSTPASQEAGKSRNPTKGAKDKQRRATITGVETVAVKETAPRRYSLKRTIDNLDNDDEQCYDIPPDDTQPNPIQTGENNIAENIKSRLPSTTRRKSIAKKPAKEVAKPLKVNQNKRQSAPAALGQVNARRTGQRQAAAAARKKLVEADSNDDEFQVNQAVESEALKQIQKSNKEVNAGSTQHYKRKPANPNTLGEDQRTVQQQGGKQRYPSPLAAPEIHLALEPPDDLYGASPIRSEAKAVSVDSPLKQPFDDLYDATPIKPTKNLVQKENTLREKASRASLPTQDSQILGRMAAKMTSLLGDLDEPYEIEDLPGEQEKEQRIQQPRKISKVSAEKGLVNDYFARKTPVVAFNEKGARNQGRLGLISNPNRLFNEYLKNSTPTDAEQAGDRKRKWETANGGDSNTPLRKRQSLSPNHNQTAIAGNDEYFRSSPPHAIESDNQDPDSCEDDNFPELPRVSKYGSQGSRVDRNGSPLATRSSQIDRIGKVKRKLQDNGDSEEVRTPELASKPLFPTISPDIFGPKFRLGSLPKARPSSSLEDTESRFIPHKKTRNGHYEVIGTNEIIELEKPLLDPFIDKDVSRPTSEFSDRLLAGSSSAIAASKRVRKGTHHDGHSRLSTKAKPLPATTQTKGSKTTATSRVSRRLAEVFVDEAEDTLVQLTNRSPSDKYSVPEMTTDTSYDSRSPLAEKSKAWNMAVRPHYENLSETIHKIADEVIIRLADEEDAIKLIANQYKENGEKLLYQAAQKRSEEKAAITNELDQKQREMVALYTEAKGLADRTKQTLEKSPLSAVGKQWRAQGDAVQEQINKGKKASERG